jgi:hypothetical protein
MQDKADDGIIKKRSALTYSKKRNKINLSIFSSSS